MSIRSLIKSNEKLFLLLIIFLALLFSNNAVRECFSGSYSTCIANGYTKALCVQTPTSVIGPGGCVCPDGSIGSPMPGFGGKCICNNYNNPNNNYFSQFLNPSNDYPFGLISD